MVGCVWLPFAPSSSQGVPTCVERKFQLTRNCCQSTRKQMQSGSCITMLFKENTAHLNLLRLSVQNHAQSSVLHNCAVRRTAQVLRACAIFFIKAAERACIFERNSSATVEWAWG